MSTREEMIAHNRTVEEIATELGANSLAYLSLEGVYEAIGSPAESHCDACFTGRYPLGDGGEGNGKFALEDLTAAASSASREPQATGHPAQSDAGAAGSGAPVASR
jgi:amidophosphoribosyltransferase